MPGLILAAVSPDNTPAGYNWTFAFPGLLFIIIALVLYALYSRPHRRVPSRPISATSAGSRAPDARTARAAAVAGGLSVAPGGGTSESPTEPAGAQAAPSEAAPSEPATSEPGGAHLTGSISLDDEAPEGGGESQPGTGDGA
jgi:septal ring-binding cell division protein DamX